MVSIIQPPPPKVRPDQTMRRDSGPGPPVASGITRGIAPWEEADLLWRQV